MHFIIRIPFDRNELGVTGSVNLFAAFKVRELAHQRSASCICNNLKTKISYMEIYL